MTFQSQVGNGIGFVSKSLIRLSPVLLLRCLN